MGFLPLIEYDMYDVAILVRPSDQLQQMERTSVNFHIAYVNPAYTKYQMAFRTVFTIISLLVLCLYCTKILCRVPTTMQG